MNILTLKLIKMKRVLLLFMIILTISCSKDEDKSFEQLTNDSYILVYSDLDLLDHATTYAGSKITYSNSFEFIDSEYNEDSNTITVQTKSGPIIIDSNLYVEGGSKVTVTLYNSSGQIIDQRSIEQTNYNYVYEF